MRNQLENKGSRSPRVVAHIPDVSGERVYRAEVQQPVAVQRAPELKPTGSLLTIVLKIAFFALIGVASAQLVVYLAGHLGARPQDATQASFDAAPAADKSNQNAGTNQLMTKPMADPAISSQLRILLEKSEKSTASFAENTRSQRSGTARRDASSVLR